MTQGLPPIGWLMLALIVGSGLGWVGATLSVDNTIERDSPAIADTVAAVVPSVVNVTLVGGNTAVGSGFAIEPDVVVTAHHLVWNADQILVRDLAGQEYKATLLGSDARTDLAVIKLEGASLQVADVGSSHGLRVGDRVLALGNPYGLGHTLSVGHVGHRGRKLNAPGPSVDFIQLAMALHPGNSGGPIFDDTGRVVAVLSGTHATGVGIAFAVPIESLLAELEELKEGTVFSRAFLGLSAQLRDGALVVSSVLPGGPAARAGVRTLDEIRTLDGEPIASREALQAKLDERRGGAKLSMELRRGESLVLVDVVLADWAEQPIVVSGMTIRPAPGAGGQVVAVRPRSRAEAAGVAVGDLVRSVNGVPQFAPADVRDALEDGGAAALELQRDGTSVALQLDAITMPK